MWPGKRQDIIWYDVVTDMQRATDDWYLMEFGGPVMFNSDEIWEDAWDRCRAFVAKELRERYNNGSYDTAQFTTWAKIGRRIRRRVRIMFHPYLWGKKRRARVSTETINRVAKKVILPQLTAALYEQTSPLRRALEGKNGGDKKKA